MARPGDHIVAIQKAMNFEALAAKFGGALQNVRGERTDQEYVIGQTLNGGDLTLFRLIIVSEIDAEGKFGLLLKYTVRDPESVRNDATIWEKTYQKDATFKHDIDFCIREINDLLQQSIEDTPIPKKDHLLKMMDINNKWLTSSPCQVELYLDQGDLGDDWRYRLVSRSFGEKKVYQKHINPDDATGHLCYLMYDACVKNEQRGFVRGVIHAATRAAQAQFETAFRGTGIKEYEIPLPVQHFMKSGRFGE